MQVRRYRFGGSLGTEWGSGRKTPVTVIGRRLQENSFEIAGLADTVTNMFGTSCVNTFVAVAADWKAQMTKIKRRETTSQ